MTMGNISLSQEALVDVSSNAGGSVKIRGGQLIMNQAAISADTSEANGAPVALDINVTGEVSLSNTDLPALTARTSGAGNAGDIVISSGSLNATYGHDEFADSFHVSLIDSDTTGSGHGGNVTITTGPLSVTSSSLLVAPKFILSGTSGDGAGGNVTITASDAHFTSMGIDTGGLTTFFGPGAAGNLTIKAQSLILENSVLFATDSMSKAGLMNLESAGLLKITGSTLNSQSLMGDNPITIKADRFVLGDASQILSTTVFEPGGDVSVTTRIVEFSNSGLIATQTFGDGNAGNIILRASERASFTDDLAIVSSIPPSGLYTTSLGEGGNFGKAGNITVSAPRLELSNGARINASTLTSGQGGNVNITNANSVLIAGERSSLDGVEAPFVKGGTNASGIYTVTSGSEFCAGICGKAGDITITTGSLTLQNGGLIDSGTTNNGAGGNITVSAGQVLLSGTMLDGTPGGIFSRTTGTNPDAGSGGNILLQAGSTLIQNGAHVSASSLGPGAAGSVTIEGTASPAQSVLIDGAGSGIFTDTQDTGAGGNILVNADSVTISNGGTLSAKTSGTTSSAVGGTITVNADQVQVTSGGLITASTTGAGAGGSVNINAGNTFSSNSGTVSSTASQATGGDISLTAGQSVTLTNGASISASSTGPGNTGNIQINAGNQFAMTNSTVTTEANQASGGAIKITTNPNGTVQLTDSTISASVLDGTGGGGSVNIDPQYVVLQNSQILANAVFGPGGNINHHDESSATGFHQSNLGLLAVWPARHDHHSIAHFSSQRQDRSSRAEALAADVLTQSTLRSTRRWEYQQLHRCGTRQLACRTRRVGFDSIGLEHV